MDSHTQRVVVHITSPDRDDWEMALRNLSNLVRNNAVSTPPDLMTVVVNGPAVEYLQADDPKSIRVKTMAQSGVDIEACENSLDRFGVSMASLAEGVTTTDSGVAEAVRIQHRGATYLKLP